MISRRTYLRTVGVAAGVGTLAGCLDSGDPGDDGDPVYVPTEPDYRGWFDGVSTYKGTIDARGTAEVTIDVGVSGGNGYYYFGPAAVAVSPGTTVTWRWTGRGGTHNVVSESGVFDSGHLVDSEGVTFTYTFEQPRIYKYYCEPHKSLGMRGAVFVALDDVALESQRDRGPGWWPF